jgi:hypothetical protein
MSNVEYRVRPVVRYVVTRYRHASAESRLPPIVDTLGEFDNERFADEVTKALLEVELAHAARAERDEAARTEFLTAQHARMS